ncbi:hypothetical protein F4604DRAFT_1683366 [Suillus subluteus]|nr:hypothetical protein F4604DRAFT_1683366 [Suillus subluteus]
MPLQWQLTQEQHMWLMPRLTQFRQVSHGNEPAFWVELYDDWFQQWPEQDDLWPDHPVGDALSKEQEKELRSAEKVMKQLLRSWMLWAWVVAGLLMDVVLYILSHQSLYRKPLVPTAISWYYNVQLDVKIQPVVHIMDVL